MSNFEFNVPLPVNTSTHTGLGGDKHKLRNFPVGASRFIPKFGDTPDSMFAGNMATSARAKNKGAKIVREMRVENGVRGVRLWRTE